MVFFSASDWVDSLHSRRMLLTVNEWQVLQGAFSISTKAVYLQRCSVATWLVPPRELAAAISAHVLCTV